ARSFWNYGRAVLPDGRALLVPEEGCDGVVGAQLGAHEVGLLDPVAPLDVGADRDVRLRPGETGEEPGAEERADRREQHRDRDEHGAATQLGRLRCGALVDGLGPGPNGGLLGGLRGGVGHGTGAPSPSCARGTRLPRQPPGCPWVSVEHNAWREHAREGTMEAWHVCSSSTTARPGPPGPCSTPSSRERNTPTSRGWRCRSPRPSRPPPTTSSPRTATSSAPRRTSATCPAPSSTSSTRPSSASEEPSMTRAAPVRGRGPGRRPSGPSACGCTGATTSRGPYGR